MVQQCIIQVIRHHCRHLFFADFHDDVSSHRPSGNACNGIPPIIKPVSSSVRYGN
jgi:hypothetical protein